MMVHEEYPTGSTPLTHTQGATRYTYDDDGRTTQIVSPEGTIHYGYESATGRLARTFTGSDPNDPVTDVQYDYDQLGRLSTVTVAERNNQVLTTPEVWRYDYDPVGKVQRVDLANGIILDYVYDNLNRLEELIHYAPDATPNDLSDNAKIAEFDYELRADGKREALNETFWENGVARSNRTEWTYDAVGRLVDEVFDSWDDSLDYAAHYTLDLLGNRLEKTTDQGRNGTVDERITSTFDANDRLLGEVKDVAAGTDTTTTYSYGGPTDPATMQTKKEVRDTASGTLVEESNFDYNLQNRLSTAVTEQFDASGNVIRRETSAFEYDTSGIRAKATRTIEVDDDSNPSTPLIVESSTETSYLNDPHNLTGYSQVLEETVRDLLTNTLARQLIYTIAHDVLAQTLFTPGGPTNGETLLILPDGHGTTRMLADLSGQILTAAYKADGTTPVPFLLYDAFGNPLNFAPSLARTSLLYTGEQFDPLLAHYYLRARYYNPATGRFSRLDPFAGELVLPNSLHRYGYAHSDPLTLTDPSGQAVPLLLLLLLGAGFALNGLFFIWDSQAAVQAIEDNDPAAAAFHTTMAIIDLFLVWLPYSGLGAQAVRGGASLLMRTGVALALNGAEAGAIYGTLRLLAETVPPLDRLLMAKQNAPPANQGPPGGTFKGVEGPGAWYQMPYTNKRSAIYQSFRNGKPLGWDFWFNGVRFDGWRNGTLLKAKYNWGRGLLRKKTGKFYEFAEKELLDQAFLQNRARGNHRVLWEWADESAADAARELFQRHGLQGFDVQYVPIPRNVFAAYGL